MNVYSKHKIIYELLLKAIRLLNTCRIFIERLDSHTPGKQKLLDIIEEFDEEVLAANTDEHKEPFN